MKIVQVGDNAVGTRTASSTASSMLSCGKTNESCGKTNEFSMSFEVEWTTTTTEEHVERGAEIDAKGGGRSEVRFANFSFFSNCPRLPSAHGNGDGVDVDEG